MVRAGDNVTLTNAGNDVTTFAASAPVAGASLAYTDANDVTIGSVDGTAGVSTSDSPVTIAANRMTVNDAIAAPGSTVTLAERTAGRKIDLGSTTDLAANTLELSDAELDEVSASVLRVGDSNAGDLNVSAAISPANANTLSLITGGALTQAGSITAGALRTASAGATTLSNTGNDVTTVAGTTSGAGSTYTYTDGNGVSVGSVDGQDGIATTDADVAFTTGATGGVQILKPLIAGGSRVMTLNMPGGTTSTPGGVQADQLKLLGGAVTFNFQTNFVHTIAANVTSLNLTDQTAATIGTVAGTDGINATAGGAAVSTAAGDLTVAKNVHATGTASVSANGKLVNDAAITGSGATLSGGKMDLAGGTVDVGTGSISVLPSATLPFVLGPTTDSGSGVELSDAEFDTLTAKDIFVGPTGLTSYTFTGEISPRMPASCTCGRTPAGRSETTTPATT